MYRIGLFSKISKITIKALRFYEEEGLLEAQHIDPATGYRYYSSKQLFQAHRIKALKQCGFSLPEIRQLLKNTDPAALYNIRKEQLMAEIEQKQQQLQSLDFYLSQSEKNNPLRYEIVEKELAPVLVYSKRFIAESYDSYFSCIPEIGREILEANPGLLCKSDPEYCFIIYHDGEYKEYNIDIEFCEAVTSRGKDCKDIRFKHIPGVSHAACVLHKGPYSRLRHAYAALFEWIESHAYKMADKPRESFIDGIWNKDDPENWLTEVQVPLKTED